MNKYYTSGQLSKMTNVSKKTLRYYHEINLLQPESYTESGYKLYGIASIKKLQKILMLKYLQFPLNEIKTMIENEEITDSLKNQEKLIEDQIQHLNQVLQAVRHLQLSSEDNWNEIIDIIKLTQQKEELIKQYNESNNLENRINIHQYSTSEISWYKWLFDKLNICSNFKIMEIGCGTAQFWNNIKEYLPENLEIILTDNSEKMLSTAKQTVNTIMYYYKSKNISFKFKIIDAEDFIINDNEFDLIMANHMLYHVDNKKRELLLSTCKSLLKENGTFCASTVGNQHLEELMSALHVFDQRIELPGWMTEEFELENGYEQLKEIFNNVSVSVQDNNLLVPDYKAIIAYVSSFPGNTKMILNSRKKDAELYFKSLASVEKPFFISKKTGVFIAKK